MGTSQQGNGLIITSVISYHQQLIEIKIFILILLEHYSMKTF